VGTWPIAEDKANSRATVARALAPTERPAEPQMLLSILLTFLIMATGMPGF